MTKDLESKRDQLAHEHCTTKSYLLASDIPVYQAFQEGFNACEEILREEHEKEIKIYKELIAAFEVVKIIKDEEIARLREALASAVEMMDRAWNISMKHDVSGWHLSGMEPFKKLLDKIKPLAAIDKVLGDEK